jgi:hypothetical protein
MNSGPVPNGTARSRPNPSIDYGQADAGAFIFLAAVQALEGAVQLAVLQRKPVFATEV